MKWQIKEFFYLANLLSLSRIALTLPISYFIINNTPTGNIWLIALLLLAGFTDYLDGYFSRKFNQVTDLGIILDPIADKVSLGIIMVLLVIYRAFPASLVILLLFRDLMIVVLGAMVLGKVEKPPMANMWGKVNTNAVAFTSLFFLMDLKGAFLTGCLLLSYATIILSAISYYKVGEDVLVTSRGGKIAFRLVAILLSAVVLYYCFTLDAANIFFTSLIHPAMPIS